MAGKRLSHHLAPHIHSSPSSGQAGQHHAHALSLTALFVYFQFFVFLTLGFYFVRATAPQILGTASFGADQIIALTNQKRVQNGLGTLTFNGLLAQAASAKAANMFSENYWAHNSPSGKTPWSFINAAGYRYVTAGENLARDFGDAPSVVNAWMNSPTHRSNLLDKNFAEIGVAVESGKLQGRDGILVVQMFGSQVSQIAAPLAQNTPRASVAPTPSSPVPSALKLSPTPLTSAQPVAAVPEQQAPQSSGQALQQAPSGQATVLSMRQFSIAKFASLALIGFIFALFVLEIAVTVKRVDLSVRSGVIAHLGLLGFILLALWYAVQGAII